MATIFREPLLYSKRVAVTTIGFASAGLAIYFAPVPNPVFGRSFTNQIALPRPNVGFVSGDLLTNTLGVVAPVPKVQSSFTKQLLPFKQNGFTYSDLLLNTLGPVAPVPKVLSTFGKRIPNNVSSGFTFSDLLLNTLVPVSVNPVILSSTPSKPQVIPTLNSSFNQKGTNYLISAQELPVVGMYLGNYVKTYVNNNFVPVNLLSNTLAPVVTVISLTSAALAMTPQPIQIRTSVTLSKPLFQSTGQPISINASRFILLTSALFNMVAQPIKFARLTTLTSALFQFLGQPITQTKRVTLSSAIISMVVYTIQRSAVIRLAMAQFLFTANQIILTYTSGSVVSAIRGMNVSLRRFVGRR